MFFFKPDHLGNEKDDTDFATKRIRDKLDSIHEKIGLIKYLYIIGITIEHKELNQDIKGIKAL